MAGSARVASTPESWDADVGCHEAQGLRWPCARREARELESSPGLRGWTMCRCGREGRLVSRHQKDAGERLAATWAGATHLETKTKSMNVMMKMLDTA